MSSRHPQTDFKISLTFKICWRTFVAIPPETEGDQNDVIS
jgi:hypothetical protein